ncbi:MAG: hypothetical protein LBO66_01120 [Deltaproteobacteria bacterium]|jgi:hypothetical protein|nr:hypothetical protein [Deltaproteobacteria bacterium]
MSYFNLSAIKGREYLYGGISLRKRGEILGGKAGAPKRVATCLGRIESATRNLIINNKYFPWIDNHGNELAITIDDFAIRRDFNVDLESFETEYRVFELISKKNAPGYAKKHFLETVENILSKNLNTKINSEIQNEIKAEGIQAENNDTPEIIDYNDESDKARFKFYGATYLLSHIIKDIGLRSILEDIFTVDADKIITLIQFLIIEKRNLMYCEYFAEANDTYSSPEEVCPQRISELLLNINEEKIRQFYQKWATFIGKTDSFNQKLTNSAWFIFLGDKIKNTEEALSIYRMRDIIEKEYQDYKTRLDFERPRMGNIKVYQSKSFIGFLSLIVFSKIREILSNNQLFKSCATDEALLKLNVIRIHKENNKSYISSLTSTQKKLFDCFNCPYPITHTFSDI